MSASPAASLEKTAGNVGAPAIPERRASHKWLIALAVMLGTTLEVLDTSIVNVALPHMQGSFSASVDEIAWVLTSYLVANGIMIPMTGMDLVALWTQALLPMSVAVFVLASGLCGAARSLDQMVIFRLIQGAAGAAMVPSSQAILMETFPPERTAARDGDMGDGVDGRADDGADARRMDHRQLELALEFLHQPADRRRGVPDGVDLRPRPGAYSKSPRKGREDRLHRYRLSGAWPRPLANSYSIAGSGPIGSVRRGSVPSRQSQ